MKWNTDPLYDENGTEWMDRHPHRRVYLKASMQDAMFYIVAWTLWLCLLLIQVGT